MPTQAIRGQGTHYKGERSRSMGEGGTNGIRPRVHWLRRNHRDWSPRAVAFFDTYNRSVPDTEPEVNELVVWYGERIVRSKKDDIVDRYTASFGKTGGELATWIDNMSVGIDTLWLYAHNLTVDLFTTRLLDRLIGRGWELAGSFSISDTSPFFRLSKGTKRLVITDAWSWLPQALEVIGKAIGIPTHDEDRPNDISEYEYRCRTNVRILSTAILQLMDWWDSHELGNWAVTGNATGWNAMRHMLTDKQVLIDPDKYGRNDDHQSIYGGRRDAWRTGYFSAGPYIELDFRDSHPTLAAYLPMPYQRRRQRDLSALSDATWLGDTSGIIAECIVTCSEPRYPVRWSGGTWYPVGTFATVLAGPELAMAESRGELVQVHHGRRHQLAPYMSKWGEWAIATSNNDSGDVPPVAQLAARGWGRTVIGKWSAKTSRVLQKNDALYGPYHLVHGWTMANQCKITQVSIAGTEWTIAKEQWADNAYPAVWAWVESHLRVRLATVIDALPYKSIISCHTDGLIVDTKRLAPFLRKQMNLVDSTITDTGVIERWCEQISMQTQPLQLRVKKIFTSLNVYGPAHMIVDGQRRWSGVRKDAKVIGPLEFRARQWPKLSWQLQHYTSGGYLRPTVVMRPTGPFVHRWHTDDDMPAPIVMEWSPETGNRVKAWWESYSDSLCYRLTPKQHPDLPRSVTVRK